TCVALPNFLTKEAPYKGPGADSEEKREPVSDIDIAVADSLKVLDLKRPIREATELRTSREIRKVPMIGIGGSLSAPPLPHHRAYGSVHGGSRSCANAFRSRLGDRAIRWTAQQKGPCSGRCTRGH